MNRFVIGGIALRPAWGRVLRGGGRLGLAGLLVGAAWGVLASSPRFAYLLALPGGWVRDGNVSLLTLLGQLDAPRDRVAILAGLHALFGLASGGLAGAAIGWTGPGDRLLRAPAALLGAIVGAAAGFGLGPIWVHRGLAAPEASVLAAVGFGAWGAIALASAEAVLRRRRLARAAGLLGVAVLALFVVAAVWRPKLEERHWEPGAQTRKQRLLLLGLDAASWANLEPAIEEGRLPHLARLRERGVWGSVEVPDPVLSPVVWTTIATGATAERHGIQDFAEDGVPVTSNVRRAHAFWELASEQGLRTAVHYWWASWPAERIRGRVVTDRFLEPSLPYRVSPEEDIAELERIAEQARARAPRTLDLVPTPLRDGVARRHPEKLRVLDEILERDAVVTALGERALSEGFDIVAVYLRAPDAVGHKFWKWHEQARRPWLARVLYGPADQDQSALGGMVGRVHEIIDAQVGRLISATEDELNVIVVSDHGMTAHVSLGRSGSNEGETGNHHSSGMILLSGPSVRSNGMLHGATVYDVFPTLLYLAGIPVPEGLPGRVLSESVAPGARRKRLLWISEALDVRRTSNPEPIPTGSDDAYLDQLRALGYVVDDE